MPYTTPPTTVVDEPSDRPHKRTRHEPPEHGMDTWTQEGAWCEGAGTGSNINQLLEPRDSVELGYLPQDVGSRLVCYGMLVDVPIAKRLGTLAHHSLASEPAFLGPNSTIHRRVDGSSIGTLEDHASQVLPKLAADGQIELQLGYTTEDAGKARRKTAVYFLQVILYGPDNLANDVGDFITKCGYYLQDPLGCARNVPYLNPQRLSSLDECLPMTFDLQREQHPCISEYTRAADDILTNFETTEVLPQAKTPCALRTKLQVHQKQALGFFKRRELGRSGIWTPKTSASGTQVFVNTVTDEEQVEPPPMWNGGILADEMGLGKTLSIIALVASDKDPDSENACWSSYPTNGQAVATTLVVVPPNVLPVWETQLALHTRPGKVTWFKHHGKSRFRPANFDEQIDIVLTTYQTVMSEHQEFRRGKTSVFPFHWKRIVLDEAHVIRNWKSSTAKAIASLSATSRWAISGTPIQNSLADFFGLFNFLRFHPYNNHTVFDKEIFELWRNRPAEEAVERFKKLLSCVMIRRQKSTTTVQLPPVLDKIIRIPFDADEEAAYRKIERPVVGFLDEADEYAGMGKFNAIQQINKLRMACNLGTSALRLRSPSEQTALEGNDAASEMLRTRVSLAANTCDQCLQVIELSGLGMETGLSQSAYYSNCLGLLCSSCANLRHFEAPGSCECEGGVGPCTLRPITSGLITPRLTSSESSSPEPAQQEKLHISSKVRALLLELEAVPTEKSVVFSFWTSSIDMVQQALQTSGIRFVRIDGKVPHHKRKHLLDRFRKDAAIRVILITISCGAVGLDLTAASRAHMLEPQWNPSMEEQAMARLHRIGQMHAVTTIRYVMKNSLEEHILNVQDRKKLLAKLLLSDDKSSQELRSLFHKSDT
ncbi:hypothetical protein EJ04DRAFT_83930 [Polyplosphaeria fusca]|uniref:Uncharacterized protein n=1 Tax=Polyplosphaeria fusca TaxID=682080 RepID=A0A9P4QMB0_9PLEO|nr:hypothetical protein EJ04DRAFT_83930 [Polyplosphaeria fusca]